VLYCNSSGSSETFAQYCRELSAEILKELEKKIQLGLKLM
jgi:hypothetical protein